MKNFRRSTAVHWLSTLALLCLLTLCFASCNTNSTGDTGTTAGTPVATAPQTDPLPAETDIPTEASTETEPMPQIALTFDLGDGRTTVVNVTDTMVFPEKPTYEGYGFKGWFTEPNGQGNRVTLATPVTGPATYYAYRTEAIDMTDRNIIKIGGYNGITEDVAVESDFAALAECGVDEIYMTFFHDDSEDGRYSLQKSLQYMEWMEKYGIKCWYNDFKLNDLLAKRAPEAECRALLEVYCNSSSFAGNFLADEPVGDRFDELATAAAYYAELMPNHQMYVNLLPNFASPAAYIEGDFTKYVQAFADRFPFTYVSQDFYPIDISDDKKKKVSASYYDSMYTTATIARDTGKENWMYIYTMRDTVNAIKDYEPTIDDLRFEAFNAMAYGCNSITYFCFDCPPSYSRSESYGMMKNHEKTPLFDTGVQITREIKALADVFPKYLWQDVCYFGTRSQFVRNVQDTAKTYDVYMEDVKCSDTDLLIGVFDEANGDGKAYMIVYEGNLNKPADAEISVKITGAAKVTAHIGTEAVVLESSDGYYTFTLHTGQGCFLTVEY